MDGGPSVSYCFGSSCFIYDNFSALVFLNLVIWLTSVLYVSLSLYTPL